MERTGAKITGGYRRGSILRSYTRNWQLYMLLVPTIAFFLIFRYMPMYGIQIAFKNYLPTLGFAGSKWVGFKYFARFFSSYYAGRQIANTFSISLGMLLFSFPVPILIALTLNEMRSRRYKKIVQTITYAPHFLSTVVIIGLIGSLTNIRYGLFNKALMGMGWIDTAIPFATKAEWFRPLYILSGIWQESGWNAVIYMAALSSVDLQLYEAARVDGAGRLRCIWHVTIPWILPTMITMLILNSGKIMNIGYEKVLLMQNSLNISTSDVITTYVYQQGLQNGQYSYATAIGLFNSVINTILIVAINTFSRRVSETSLW
jgi:putative aldouronate transport system permease protein